MAANLDPIFPIVPTNTPGVLINAANTARDGSGSNFFTAFTAGANGAVLRKVRFWASQAVVGVVASKVLSIYVTTSGVKMKVGEVLLTGTTTTNIIVTPSALWTADDPIPLKPGALVEVTASLAATAADYTFAYPIVGDY